MARSDRAAGDRLTSIVITNYNYARFLEDAIESALGQRGDAVEVVVVDDGSTDDSRAVMARFGGRIRTVLQDNGGQAAAINRGFEVARGDLVMFLDADDRLEPDAAARLRAAWRPGTARVHGPVLLIDERGRPNGGRLPVDPLPAGDVRRMVLKSGDYPSTGTTGVAFSRTCLERLLPVSVEDWRSAPDVYLRLLSPFVGPVAAVDEVVGHVRVHGQNAWSMARFDVRRLAEHLAVDEKKEALLVAEAGAADGVREHEWRLRSPWHLQSRLALLRLGPSLHPYPGDRRWRLAVLGIRAALGHRGFGMTKRLLLAGWFAAVAVLPTRVARPVAEAAFIRGRRPRWLQAVLERGRGAGA